MVVKPSGTTNSSRIWRPAEAERKGGRRPYERPEVTTPCDDPAGAGLPDAEGLCCPSRNGRRSKIRRGTTRSSPLDGDIKNAYSSARATRERFLQDVEDEASRRNQTTDDEKLAELAAVPPPAPYAVQRDLTDDFRGIDGYGWYLGGQAAPLARENLAATLAAETAAALR
jgi:hypothetical protein